MYAQSYLDAVQLSTLTSPEAYLSFLQYLRPKLNDMTYICCGTVSDKKISGIFADTQHGLALYMCQTLIRG
jgi:hypothetical protein